MQDNTKMPLKHEAKHTHTQSKVSSPRTDTLRHSCSRLPKSGCSPEKKTSADL